MSLIYPMSKQELLSYLNNVMPDAIECKIEASYIHPGQYDAVCTKYEQGRIARQEFEAGWSRKLDAFTYSVGMLRTRQADAGILNNPEDN